MGKAAHSIQETLELLRPYREKYREAVRHLEAYSGSRRHYGRPREVVERKIARALGF
jgi:hypothetical protein